jgi:DNA-binding transcriptional LysR family regulator
MSERLDFSLTQLRYFVTSAELGNISDAAQVLHASQSAVSMAIQRLERQLETQLFLRHRTKGVSLTPSGRLLLADARSLLRQAHRLRLRSREWNGALNGMLNIACLPSIAPFVIPTVLSKLKVVHPELSVTVQEDTVDRLLGLLRDGACELAVTCELPGENLTFTKLADVRLSALLAQSDPLAAAGRATFAELATRPMLVVDAPPDHYARRSLFARVGGPVPKTFQTSSVSTLLGLVGAGEGFALQHRRLAAPALADGGQVVSVDLVTSRPCVSEVGVTALPGVPMSRRAKEFVAVLREAVHEVYCVAEQGTNGSGVLRGGIRSRSRRD